LNGKPAPDTFIEAARQLGVKPERAVVVEDAISGVQAGHAGEFGLVIGVARHGDADELRKHGADFVVDDLGELVP
jgi:beta-phosphoglucomutase-like phosphatase (HAD superfamily)